MRDRNNPLDPIVLLAIQDGAYPGQVEVGQVYERVPMLCRDGRRLSSVTGRRDHTRIRITAIPGGRRRKIAYVKVDPRPMGNGRPDRGEHMIDLHGLIQHYALAERPTNAERLARVALFTEGEATDGD